jgi:5-methyltetrahydropteroyltriglutamate--homocysteine methyltransferase
MMPIPHPAASVHAETVGSLLHSEELIKARRDYDAKEISREILQKIEDGEVRKAVALQERLGFQVVTDGELRRNTYIDFILTGVTGVRLEWKILNQAAGYRDAKGDEAQTPRPVPTVFDRIRRSPGSAGPTDFRFLKSTTKVLGKATIAGPAVFHFFGGRDGVSRDVYPTLDEFWSDVIAAYKEELQELRAAGCTYVQFDETSLIKLVDPAIREWMVSRGDDPDRLVNMYVEILQKVIADAPKDMRLGLHLCRGNNRGTWQAEGGYDAIAEQIFRHLAVDVFNLEYDSPRAGGFEPLRKLPEDKMVVLGLLSTKLRSVEDAEQMIDRIRDAAKVVPLERLGVSPQCGFWGGMNLCTEAEEEAKLRRVVEIAQRVWQ